MIGRRERPRSDRNGVEDRAHCETLFLFVDTAVGLSRRATVGAGCSNDTGVAANLATVTVDAGRGTYD